MQIVPKSEKIHRGGRNWSQPQLSVWKPEITLVRQEFILEGSAPDPSVPSCLFGWQRQLGCSCCGERWTPQCPLCHHLRCPAPKWPWQRADPKPCVCFWQAVLSSFSLSILRDLYWCWQGEGGWAAFPLLGINVCWSCQGSSRLTGLVGFAVSSCSCHIFSLLLSR